MCATGTSASRPCRRCDGGPLLPWSARDNETPLARSRPWPWAARSSRRGSAGFACSGTAFDGAAHCDLHDLAAKIPRSLPAGRRSWPPGRAGRRRGAAGRRTPCRMISRDAADPRRDDRAAQGHGLDQGAGRSRCREQTTVIAARRRSGGRAEKRLAAPVAPHGPTPSPRAAGRRRIPRGPAVARRRPRTPGRGPAKQSRASGMACRSRPNASTIRSPPLCRSNPRMKRISLGIAPLRPFPSIGGGDGCRPRGWIASACSRARP